MKTKITARFEAVEIAELAAKSLKKEFDGILNISVTDNSSSHRPRTENLMLSYPPTGVSTGIPSALAVSGATFDLFDAPGPVGTGATLTIVTQSSAEMITSRIHNVGGMDVSVQPY